MTHPERTPEGRYALQEDGPHGSIPVLIEGKAVAWLLLEGEQLPMKVRLPDGHVVRLEVVAVPLDDPTHLGVRAGYVSVTEGPGRELVAQKGATL